MNHYHAIQKMETRSNGPTLKPNQRGVPSAINKSELSSVMLSLVGRTLRPSR